MEDVGEMPVALVVCKKICHVTKHEAEEHMEELIAKRNDRKTEAGLNVYFCDYHKAYHVGHSSGLEKERRKLLKMQVDVLAYKKRVEARRENQLDDYKRLLRKHDAVKDENVRLRRLLHTVRGFLCTDFNNEERATIAFRKLMDAVEVAMQEESTQENPTMNKAETLTKREHQVLTALCQGKTAKEVAAELQITKRGVDFHSGNIHAKWGVSNIVQSYNEGMRRGVVFAPSCGAEGTQRGKEGAL